MLLCIIGRVKTIAVRRDARRWWEWRNAGVSRKSPAGAFAPVARRADVVACDCMRERARCPGYPGIDGRRQCPTPHEPVIPLARTTYLSIPLKRDVSPCTSTPSARPEAENGIVRRKRALEDYRQHQRAVRRCFVV